MSLLRAVASLCLFAGLLVTGVAAATFAGYALFWFSGKAVMLFIVALVLTAVQVKILSALYPAAPCTKASSS